MRCLTVSKGTVIEESKLRFPIEVNLRNVAPGNHSGIYLTGGGRSSAGRKQTARSLTEWENVDHPLSGCKTTLDGIHGFVRAMKYRMIRRVDTQSIRDFQGKSVRQAWWASQ